MKKKRSELVARLAKYGAGAAAAAAVTVGVFAANRNPRESAVVLSSIPERSVSASSVYESSANTEKIQDPETRNSDVTKPYLINLNTATSRQLQTLSGINEAKAAAIIEYRETHGGFSDISELLNISGIGEEIFENIREYVTVGDIPPKETPPQSSAAAPVNTPTEIPIININTASLEELQTLPGIGSAKAMAIVQYRSVFGDFLDISEIKNVNGIGEGIFEGIREHITVGAVSTPPVENEPQDPDISDPPDIPEDIFVDLNTATVSELCKIPGIGNVKAQAIIDYRESYGDFYSIEEIKNVSGIGDKLFESIRDYIYVEYRERPSNDKPADEPSQDQPSEPSANYPVNLNTATVEELCTLPNIGEERAAAILKYRSDHGGFSDIREIRNVIGISDSMFTKLRYLITV